jgi:hypothetical protein
MARLDVGLGGGASHHLRGRFVPDGQGRKIQEKCMGYNTVARTKTLIYKQLHLVKIMIRRFGRETLSTYCQTLNGCAMPTDFNNSGRENAFFYLWTFFGKQNM